MVQMLLDKQRGSRKFFSPTSVPQTFHFASYFTGGDSEPTRRLPIVRERGGIVKKWHDEKQATGDKRSPT